MGYDLTEIKEAAARLARCEEAKAHYDALNAVITKVPDVPVRLLHPANWINPLLQVSKESPETFKTLVQWANDKRVQRGFTPLYSDNDEFDKVEYMREFMAQKRERERRAVRIENAKRPERDRLVGRSREEYQRRLAAEWRAERERRMAATRASVGGRRLTKPEMQEVLRLFWEDIDTKLEAASRAK